jgi:hypothetical protein
MPTSTPVHIAANYTLVTEIGADLKASLYAVRTDGSGKVLLDQGAYSHQHGKIVNGRVFFERPEGTAPNNPLFVDRNIYSINVDGTDRRQLTFTPDDDHIAAVVGDRIIIERVVPNNSNIYSPDLMSIRLDGSDLRALAIYPQRKDAIAFVPATGKRLLINSTSDTAFGVFENNLYAVDTDGSALTTIADSPANEKFKALLGNTVIFQEASTPQNGQPVVNVKARNFLDGSGATTLSDGPGYHFYVGSYGAYAVIFNGAANRVEAVRTDGTDRRLLVEGFTPARLMREGVLFYEQEDSLGVQQVFGLDVAAALKGVKKPPVQLTHASTSSFIHSVVAKPGNVAELKTIIIYRPFSTGYQSGSVHAVRFGHDGIQETLLAEHALSGYQSFVHQGRFIFRISTSTPYYSVKLDGTGLVKLLGDQPGTLAEELIPHELNPSVGSISDDRLIVIRVTKVPPAESANERLVQVFGVNADGSNATPLTAPLPQATWAAY